MLLKDPKIIVADDPTDVMDSQSEIEICMLFSKLKETRTIIVSSSRQSMLDIADIIVALKN